MDIDLPENRRDFFVYGLLLTLLTLVCYGPPIPWLGFYWDDWFLIWVGHSRGMAGLIENHGVDRPVLGALLGLYYDLLGDRVILWRLLALFLFWCGVIVFWMGLRRLWPDKAPQTFLAAALFAIYPGFLQQPVSVVYQGLLTGLDLALLSLALTICALNEPRRSRGLLFLFPALVLEGAYLLLVEYMIGFEAIRLLLIWRSRKSAAGTRLVSRLKSMLTGAASYLVMVLIFLLWRFFAFHGERASTNPALIFESYARDIWLTAMTLAARFVVDLFEASLFAWFVPPWGLFEHVGGATFYLLAAGIAAFLLFLFAGARWKGAVERFQEDNRDWGGEALGLGLGGVVLALLPVILADKHIMLLDILDRYTLHAAPWACLTLVGFVCLCFRSKHLPWIAAALISMALTAHWINAYVYAKNWDYQRRLWWEMSWRVPQFKPGTLILYDAETCDEKNQYDTGSPPPAIDSYETKRLPAHACTNTYEVWSPANLIYGGQGKDPKVWAFILSERKLFEMKHGAHFSGKVRKTAIPYDLTMSNALVVSGPTERSCLRVLGPDPSELPLDAGSRLQEAAAYSRPDVILTDAAPPAPPPEIFGEEPEHGWCYYFEQAELARQRGDYARVAGLGDEARLNGLQPRDPTEWLPFLEGYLRTGRKADADKLIRFFKDSGFMVSERLNEWLKSRSSGN